MKSYEPHSLKRIAKADLCGLTCVDYRKDDHTAYVTLNRPEVLNAMNHQMHAELRYIWDDFENDDDIWFGVITGAGERAFSVGQDLKELAEDNKRNKTISTFGSFGKPGWPRLTERFDMKKPLIACLNGHAFGGGLELALACDIIIAAEHVSLALPEARLGLIAGAGGVFRLINQIPYKLAMGYLLTGRRMSALRAYEMGLVNEVVPAAALSACLERWRSELRECAPLSIRAIKEAASSAAHLSIQDAFQQSYPAEEYRARSDDAREGASAFAEKRRPQWTSR